MRIPFRRRHATRRRLPSPLSHIIAITSLAASPIQAINFTPATPNNVDLSQLGSIGIAGDFSGVSLYSFEEQNQNPVSRNGSQALLARMPNSIFASVVQTDASIMAMCSYTLSDGNMAGVVLGGNFTSLSNNNSTAIALFNPNSSQITPLAGLSGQVNALLCDGNAVYVGGNFRGLDSTNAIAWMNGSGWQNLPFSGFNGPVTSITKASNGHIIFGGRFTGLGNASIPTTQRDGQVINLSTATITSGSSASAAGFSDPKNIICKTSGADGSGNTWLLRDNTPGFWQAAFDFGFNPTKIRLYNTHQDGRGTKTWRYTVMPNNGIMNFTYIDPATGQNRSCTSECPLSNDKNVPFQDFHFVNVIGMNSFRIDISDWYGSGGGLNGIQLLQNDIFTFAINRFNEPTCSGSSGTLSTATATGPWTESPSLQSQSKYLTAQLSSPITESSASVVFTPNIRDGGNYSVNMYTPGCMADGTCGSRGQVNITMNMVSGRPPTTVTLFQTNNFDKYDQIYFGTIGQSTGSFRPSVTLTPLSGQSMSTMTFVAQRVGFTQLNSTGGLNGLFEFDPSVATVNASSFQDSAFDKLGSTFDTDSAVTTLATVGDVTYIGGNFSSTGANNVVAVNGKQSNTGNLGGGLNGAVHSMIADGNNLYVGGSFSATQDGKVNNLANCAVYDTSKNVWTALGAGLDGNVMKVVAMTMNVTSSTPETVMAFSGSITEIKAFGSNQAVPVNGFAVWVPSQNNWLKNLKVPVEGVEGILLTSVLNVPGAGALYGGSLSSSSMSGNGASQLFGGGSGSVGQFPVKIEPKASGSTAARKRDTLTTGEPLTGVITGLFDSTNNRNKTVMAGHFTATATNGSTIQNLVIIDGKNDAAITGIGPEIAENSTFLALAQYQDTLFAGGNVTGNVNGGPVSGIISYNLATNAYSNPQPPALSGGGNSVTDIAIRPNSGDVYVGGTFTTAGALPCPGVCMYSTSASQWIRPGTGLAGTVNSVIFSSDTNLVAGGAITVNASTSTFLANYDTGRQTWDAFPGAADLPGPVALMTPATADGSQIWVAGVASNGSVYLMKYNGQSWLPAGQTLESGTNIRSLQVLSLTSNHDANALLDGDRVLLLTGNIRIPRSGSTSAAIFNGTTFEPFAVSTSSGQDPGTISRIFVQNKNFFTSPSRGGLPLVAIVLIGLGISLFLMLLIVAAGLLLDRYRKKREGYTPAPTSMYDRSSGIQRVPPGELLQSLGKGRPGAPTV